MMNYYQIKIFRHIRFNHLILLRSSATTSDDGGQPPPSQQSKASKSKKFLPKKETKKVDFHQLQSLLSNMKIRKSHDIFDKVNKLGHSDLFNYATNKHYSQNELREQDLETWNKLMTLEAKKACLNLPTNGFEELIQLTEQGKLWKFPIDNAQGLDEEKNVPFEDHVFLEDYLEEFPKSPYVQSFMRMVVNGLAKNYWITVDRKREIIKFYKDYFEERRGAYKERGFDLE